jgi:hypothetical protein
MPKFEQGDSVLNVGRDARHHGKMGTYQRRLPWSFWGIGGVEEPGCDVLVDGECGPYGYPFIAMRESDLVKVETEQG